MTTEHPQVEAERYLEKYKIKRLFQELGTRLLYERPEDSNAFLIEILEKMKRDIHPFFNETDVQTCFTAVDIHKTGVISAEQYRNALKNLGIEAPVPLETETIDRETFVSSVLNQLAQDTRENTPNA